MEVDIENWLQELLESKMALDHSVAVYVKLFLLAVFLFIVCFVVWYLSKRIILVTIHRVARKTRTDWDDVLVERNVFNNLAYILPAVVVQLYARAVLVDFPDLIPLVTRLTHIFMTLMFMSVVNNFLNAVQDILLKIDRLKDKPINSFIQLAKIIAFFLFGVILLSLIVSRSPIYFLSAMGAVSAVLLLIFRDTILALVASIQLSANDLLRVGDWVSVPKYGADGPVIRINLSTVTVRNWDNTYTSIPPYVFISDSFQNWRGMQESGGRRIMRSINIKMNSVQHCTDEMLEEFKKIELIRDYIAQKEEEVKAYNKEHQVDESVLINGRRLTNIGAFRAYAEAFIANNPNINTDLIYQVRQLEATSTGIPIQIYAFSKEKTWVAYERVAADIFDHLIAALPTFDLEVFESPSGNDVRQLLEGMDGSSKGPLSS